MPSIGIWSSIVGKEAIFVGFFGVILVFWMKMVSSIRLSLWEIAFVFGFFVWGFFIPASLWSWRSMAAVFGVHDRVRTIAKEVNIAGGICCRRSSVFYFSLG